MIPAPRLDEVLSHLGQSLSAERPVKLVGFVFAHPRDDTAQSILARIDDYNWRFGAEVDFFFAGWQRYDAAPSDAISFPAPDGAEPPWMFSGRLYAGFVGDLEQASRFRPSGECEILLLTAGRTLEPPGARVDYSNAVVLNVAAMLRDGVIGGAGPLLEQIYQTRFSAGDLTEWSDRRGLREIAGAVADSLLSKLPLGLGVAFGKARHYVTSDLSVD